MLLTTELFVWSGRTCIACVFGVTISYVCSISSIYRSQLQRAIITCCVLSLKGNMRWPLHFYHSLGWLLGQQHQYNWIICNCKQHLFLVLCFWTPAGELSLDSIKHTRVLVLLRDPLSFVLECQLHAQQLKTIKVNKNSVGESYPLNK